MARALLLMPGATYRAPDFIEAARRLGVEVVVGSEQRQPLAELMEGRTLIVDLADPERGAEQVAEFARRHPLDAVVAVDDGGTLVAALASERLGLAHNPYAAVEATRNKHLLRQRLTRGELLSPRYRLLSVDDDPAAAAAEVAETVGWPCVVKPLSLAGSRGVIRADDAVEFAAAFERVRAILADPEVAADCGDTAGQVLVEGYIPGVEVSAGGPAQRRRSARAGALRQARPAGGAVLRGDDLHHALAAAAGRPGRGRGDRRPRRPRDRAARRPRARRAARQRRGRLAGGRGRAVDRRALARARSASGRGCRWRS